MNAPTFWVDPIYSDTVYLTHNFGIHAIWLGWLSELKDALEKSLEKDDTSQAGDASPEILKDFVDSFVSREEEALSSVTQLLDTVDPALRYVDLYFHEASI
jgi:hypothetical protein